MMCPKCKVQMELEMRYKSQVLFRCPKCKVLKERHIKIVRNQNER